MDNVVPISKNSKDATDKDIAAMRDALNELEEALKKYASQ